MGYQEAQKSLSMTPGSGAGEKTYPADLFDAQTPAPFIYFVIRDSVLKSNAVIDHLFLYMPPQIRVNYGTQWEELQMTLYQYKDLGFDLAKVLGTSIDTTLNSGIIDSLKQIVANPDIQYTAGRAITGAIDYAAGTNFGNQLDVIVGKTVNPHMALMFKGVNFREFEFTFQMMARNAGESKAIRSIIKAFKLAMHPGVTDGGDGGMTRYWRYPDNFDIYLYTPVGPLADNGGEGKAHWLFNIANCVLTDMSVDYAGSGIPTFFDGTGAPVDIRLTVRFKEQTVLNKELIEKGY